MNRATVSPRAKTLSSIALPVRWLALSCAVCWAASGVDAADDGKQTYTDPSKVPPSYAVQGEYVGVVGQENQRCAAQIIALGDERFRLVGYLGGLPGDGWQTDTERVEVEGERRGDMVIFEREGIEIEWTDGTLSVIVQEDGVAIGELNRTVRMSPSLGKEPPADAVVLFDGSSAEAFKNGKIVQDDLLLADCQSKEAFGDHSLHLEFRTPFKPAARGQARGNSGVYVQSRYEIQVLDSFGLSGESNECGGIYRVAEPKVNMCYPPLQWQTYDIDFTAARYNDAGEKIKNAKITVRHNGVVIHDDLELPSHTPGKAQEADTPGPLYLQGHGNPVVYRNIWVVPR
jgi:hypothetical protein